MNHASLFSGIGGQQATGLTRSNPRYANAPDTGIIRSKQSGQAWERGARFENNNCRMFSECTNFPTQSPVCNGNDELSTRLVGITFSKHRAESIKGYGNAIVPLLVYQIFETIKEYEQLKNKNVTIG